MMRELTKLSITQESTFKSEGLIDGMSPARAITHIGTPPAKRMIDKHMVQFHDCKNLNETKGDKIVSPEFCCVKTR